jgi:Leucine-rich repeat (LRR) protein
VEACAFCPLKNLTNLDLRFAYSLNPRLHHILDAFYAFSVNGQEVQSVNVHKFVGYGGDNVGTHLDEVTTKHLHGACIRELVLSSNYIVVLKRTAVYRPGSRFSACIRHLDLSYNAILYSDENFMFFSNKLPELTSFKMQMQKNNHIEQVVEALANARENSMDVEAKPPAWEKGASFMISIPPSLSLVNFSGTGHMYWTIPSRVTFLNATKLTHLDVSYNILRGCSTEYKGLETLQFLTLSGWNCPSFSETILDAFPMLRVLVMQRMAISSHEFFLKGTRLLRNLPHLEVLDGSKNDLEQLPDDITSRLPALRHLLISRNELTSFDLKLGHHDNLTLLDLSFNRLSVLLEPTRVVLDSLSAKQSGGFHLRLQGNPLACTCATLDFVLWLRETHVQLDLDGDYLCVTDSGEVTSTGAVGREWMAVWRRCVGPTVLWSSVAMLLLMLFVMGAAWGVAKNFTRIRFYLNVLRRVRVPCRQQFLRDAYVAYGDDDFDLVCGLVKRELEDIRGVSLLIKDLPADRAATRFWLLPGDHIAEKMLEHIALCWKVVLVLTPALTHDPMAGFMSRAVLQSITDGLSRRVLLLCVGVEHIPELTSLQALLEVVPEDQVFFLPQPAGANSRLWDNLAQAILK